MTEEAPTDLERPSVDITSNVVDQATIARMAGVSKQAVHNWTVRYASFPERLPSNMTPPIYWWPEVKLWIEQSAPYRAPNTVLGRRK